LIPDELELSPGRIIVMQVVSLDLFLDKLVSSLVRITVMQLVTVDLILDELVSSLGRITTIETGFLIFFIMYVRECRYSTCRLSTTAFFHIRTHL
jgi:hypothetical protein